MVDFSAFDSILDAAFVMDGTGKIVYCNDAAATFCGSSVRRLTGKALISDLMSLAEPGLLPFNEQSQGRTSPSPFIETEFNVPKAEKSGKAQVAIRPIDDSHWLFFLRDVSLEEALHSKYRSELAQKEDYARNLEKLVEARTSELNKVNQTLKAILNSLGQGFFTFEASGDCGDVFTKACEEILEGTPAGRKVWEVLGVKEEERETFQKWIETTFKELLPFDDMKALGPNLFPHSRQRHVVLEYYPIRREQDAISDVVVVATDKTSEREAQIALEAERLYAGMIVKFMKNKAQFLAFLQSTRKSLAHVAKLAAGPMQTPHVAEAFRVLHTVEGEAGTFSLRDLRQASRVSQQILEPYKAGAPITEKARAEFSRSIAEMSEQFEAFLKANEDLFRVPDGDVARAVEVSVTELNAFLSELKRLPTSEKLVERFEERFLQVPIETCLRYFDVLIQGVADKLGKRVKPLKVSGGDIRIHPEPYQSLFSSLVHAFRNAVDHGLESPEEREWGGKDPAGQIEVTVTEDASGYTISLVDDGKGIDPSVIRAKMKEKFPERDLTTVSDDEVIQLVSMPGFSSRDEVGEFSGRGVGLDALREEVIKIGGSFRIQSTMGQGTRITLSFPKLGRGLVISRSA